MLRSQLALWTRTPQAGTPERTPERTPLRGGKELIGRAVRITEGRYKSSLAEVREVCEQANTAMVRLRVLRSSVQKSSGAEKIVSLDHLTEEEPEKPPRKRITAPEGADTAPKPSKDPSDNTGW